MVKYNINEVLMNEILLDNTQLGKLIRNSSLALNEDNILQIYDNNLILNRKGNIFFVEDLKIQFKPREIENQSIIDDLKELVCEHLNLEPYNVIYAGGSSNECDFAVRFQPNVEWKIVVCDFHTAINNTAQISENTREFQYDANIIGLYKRLGNSPYYFRWFNDV